MLGGLRDMNDDSVGAVIFTVELQRRVRLGFEFTAGVFTERYKRLMRDVLLMCRQASLGIPDDRDHRFRAIVIAVPG